MRCRPRSCFMTGPTVRSQCFGYATGAVPADGPGQCTDCPAGAFRAAAGVFSGVKLSRDKRRLHWSSGGLEVAAFPKLLINVRDRQEASPGSRLVVISKAAHLMSYQNPAAFNAALLEFLGTAVEALRGFGIRRLAPERPTRNRADCQRCFGPAHFTSSSSWSRSTRSASKRVGKDETVAYAAKSFRIAKNRGSNPQIAVRLPPEG